jgi:hypothetical protein
MFFESFKGLLIKGQLAKFDFEFYSPFGNQRDQSFIFKSGPHFLFFWFTVRVSLPHEEGNVISHHD